MQHLLRFGTWKSTFGPHEASSGATKARDCVWNGDTLYWIESRPLEKGRCTLMSWDKQTKTPRERLQPPWNLRTRVHEYGGRAMCFQNGILYFVDDSDQQIYRWDPQGTEPAQRFTQVPRARFADLCAHPTQPFLFAVIELHDPGREPTNALALVRLGGTVDPLVDGSVVSGAPHSHSNVRLLHSDADFYSSPAISPDGTQLAWITWNHPSMPWDKTTLHVGTFNDGMLNTPHALTQTQESVCQPKWSPEGVLHWVSDATGWWNIYRHQNQSTQCLYSRQAEFCRPDWNFGQSHYDFLETGEIFCTFSDQGKWQAGILEDHGQLRELHLVFSEFDSIAANGRDVAFIAGQTALPPSIQIWNPQAGALAIGAATLGGMKPLGISKPQSMTTEGPAGLVHFFYYPPTNPDFHAPPDTLPPLIVLCHGGPTAAASNALQASIQYWTSRGFSVADVNYSGSTGYGRGYRERLCGRWGELEVQECAAVARTLIQSQHVDPDRIVIRGSSAGGMTVLNALVHCSEFKAGASYYGVTDLTKLAEQTHKFEKHYLDTLIGPWPDDRAKYVARSPMTHAEKLHKPVIFFQGLEDRVVPPAQSEQLYARLKSQGIPTQYFSFPGEGHGFRRANTVQTCLEAELAFYIQVLGLA
jgi:dipeptidyl aminopeptidase/acylaminoacyl peptidase